tara:strand:+ start:1241 stop:1510 length:270 start_codon:yes stop_codon:yes gene_type:complete
MNIKQYYMKQFPEDSMGKEIKEGITFLGLRNILYGDYDVYDYIGVGDSLVRERLFEQLSKDIGQDYDFVYDLWLSKDRKRDDPYQWVKK